MANDLSDLPVTLSPQQGVVAPSRLWGGDGPAAYDLLQVQIPGSLGPKHFLQQIWTRNMIDLADFSPSADQNWPDARRRPQGGAQGLLADCCRSMVMSSTHWRSGFAVQEFDRIGGTNNGGPKIASIFAERTQWVKTQ
jgi:hypothetical protein